MSRPLKRPRVRNPATGLRVSDVELYADAARSAERWRQRLAAGLTRSDRARPIATDSPEPCWEAYSAQGDGADWARAVYGEHSAFSDPSDDPESDE